MLGDYWVVGILETLLRVGHRQSQSPLAARSLRWRAAGGVEERGRAAKDPQINTEQESEWGRKAVWGKLPSPNCESTAEGRRNGGRVGGSGETSIKEMPGGKDGT